MEYNMNVHVGMQFDGWPDFYISYAERRLVVVRFLLLLTGQ